METKFNLYSYTPSLREYIVISSTQVLIKKYTKQSDNEWLFTIYEKKEDSFVIDSIRFRVKVNDLYRNINFKK